MYVDDSLTGAETDGFWLETSTGDVRDHVHSSVYLYKVGKQLRACYG